MTKDEFMKSKPCELKSYYLAFKLKKKMKDEEMHRQGFYNYIAFTVVMSHFGAGMSGKKSTVEYPQKPFCFSTDEYEKVEKNNSSSNEEVAVYEMKMRTKMLEKSGMKQSPS